MMAFFNLTQLGPQDPFRTASTSVAQQSSKSQDTTDSSRHTLEAQNGEHSKLSTTDVQDASLKEGSATQHLTPTSHVTMYSPNKTTTRHGGSYTKYTELLRKHERDPRGPTDLYQYPLTTSQMYGWWMKGGSPQKEKWAQNAKHVHVNSEMTRFVDEMSLTNKEFSLY